MPSLFIALERDIPGLDAYVNGHALSESDPALQQICSDLGVTPLMEFFGQDLGDFAELVDDTEESQGAAWFEAADGSRTIEALLAHLRGTPDSLANTTDVLEELGEWRTVLERAGAESVRWHVEMDI